MSLLTRTIKKRKILIIDDDSDFLESLHLMLAMDGHDVVTLANGTDAVLKYTEFNPDVVLLDVKMPSIDGYDVFLSIMQSHPDAVVYFTSGYALNDTKYETAMSQSLAGIITKPIEPRHLKKILDGLG